MAFLQDVFKDSGVPTYTFVEPNEYIKIVVTLSTTLIPQHYYKIFFLST